LARSLFLYGLSNGWIKRGKPVVECSSGSTAISEAYFARLLRLRFIAVAPRTTAKPKIEAIEFFGGEGRLVEPAQIYDEGRRKSMRLLAISGSLRRASINTAALEALARLAPEGVKVLLYRDLEKLWPFNPDDDIEDKAKPEPVETLCALVDASDALVIAAPEYAQGLPGALKNALDWLVASETFAGKPTALINTSPRAFHAQASLREILSTMAARLIPEAFVSLSLTGDAATADDILPDTVCTGRLTESLEALIAAIRG
jgi:chromate reductase